MAADENNTKIKVGYAKRDITPPLPFPLAGYITRQERMAASVHDPLTARAAVFSDGRRAAAVVTVDLLLITALLREAIEARLVRDGVRLDGLLLSATHTHSSSGGYYDAPSAKPFMGVFRQAIFDRLVDGITGAITEATHDLQPADLALGLTQTEYLNWNRRHPDSPVDRTLSVITVNRSSGILRIISFGAHPVIAAERDNLAASACYPGALTQALENEGGAAMFVVGPVGGVNVFFPEGPMKLDVHLHLLTRLLREEMAKAEAAAIPIDVNSVSFALGETPINIIAPHLFPDRLAWLETVFYPLRLWLRRFGRGGLRDGMHTCVPVVRIGDVIITGFPADLGASVGLAAKALIEKRDLRPAIVASQTGDYVGYVHLPEEYQRFQTADRDALWLIVYENGMGFGGRNVGLDLLKAFDDALKRL